MMESVVMERIFGVCFAFAGKTWYSSHSSIPKGKEAVCTMNMLLSGFLAHTGPVLCVFVAAFLQSLTGFGLAIVTAPLLMFFYDAKDVVAIVLLLCLCGNLVQGLMNIRKASLKLVGWLFLGVLCGQPAGLLIFHFLSSDALKLLINAMVLVSLCFMQAFHIRLQENNGNAFKTGILSGITSSTTGMSGPPFLIYIAHTRMEPQVLRATCFVFFFLCNASSLLAHAAGGESLYYALTEFLYLLPGLATGILVGNVLYRYLPKGWIRRAIYILLLVTSVIGIADVLYSRFLG